MTVTKTHIMSDETGVRIAAALEASAARTAPTNSSDLNNDAGFQTAEQVNALIAAALEDVDEEVANGSY